MKKVSTIMGIFDVERFKKLKKLYNKAVEEKKESFIENMDDIKVEWNTGFAKYMVEFLTAHFK